MAPDTRISWVVDRRASEILKGSPVIDDLIELDTHVKRPIAQVRDRLSQLRPGRTAGPVDVAIDFQGLIKSGVVAWFSRAPRRFGFESTDLREKASGVFLTDQIRTAHIPGVIDKNLALALGALSNGEPPPRLGDHEFPIAVSEEDERYAEEVISSNLDVTGAGRKASGFAILNPGGGWPTKLWDTARFGEIADWLSEQHGLVSLVTYGPGEEQLAAKVASSTRSSSARVVRSTLKQFVALARRARLFVGGDTGPLHLAAASGTPIVGLYGPTSPARNGPFHPDDITVSRDLWCRQDCHRRKCWHWDCMDIPLIEVKLALTRRLEGSA
jgi:ADP-heptose:LPS heptosyltransferase